MATGGVIPVHHTKTSDGEWDGDRAERRLDNDDVSAFKQTFAYVDEEKPDRKTGAKFPHHEVSTSGDVGAANVKACISGIGILNGGRGNDKVYGLAGAEKGYVTTLYEYAAMAGGSA